MIRCLCSIAAVAALIFSGVAGAVSAPPSATTSAYKSHTHFAPIDVLFHKNNFPDTLPLLRVILNDKPDKVQHFLEEGSPATAQFRGIYPYIEVAAGLSPCNPAILKLLIKHGANPNGKRIVLSVGAGDFYPVYFIPVVAAAAGGSYECAATLLQHGANTNVTNTMGNTPLGTAAASKYCSAAMIELLIKGGADPNFVPELKDLPKSLVQTALAGMASLQWTKRKELQTLDRQWFIFKQSPLAMAAGYDHPACASALIEHGANVNYLSPREGYSPLMWAVYMGSSPAMTALLLRSGAKADARNNLGMTALFMVVGEADEKLKERVSFPPYCVRCAEMLIKAGADVNAVDTAGDTPLIFAVGAKESLPVVQLLVESGADVNYRNPKTGLTALAAAASAGNAAVVNYLKSQGASASSEELDHGGKID